MGAHPAAQTHTPVVARVTGRPRPLRVVAPYVESKSELSTKEEPMRIVSVVLGFVSAFFVFYTVRLLLVTRFLQQVRSTGHGAYVGAVAFPAIAIAFGWAAVALWRRVGRVR